MTLKNLHSLIEYYGDGKILKKTGDMEGITKSIEVKYCLLSKGRFNP
jgi:hypothetical protein